eukprot:12184129-Ditylum_brightwellii.AAC.1
MVDLNPEEVLAKALAYQQHESSPLLIYNANFKQSQYQKVTERIRGPRTFPPQIGNSSTGKGQGPYPTAQIKKRQRVQ